MNKKLKEKRLKIRNNFKAHEKALKYDDDGNKRTKQEINQLLLQSKTKEVKLDTQENPELVIKRKFSVRKIKQKIRWEDGREIERLIECDFEYV